MTGEQLVVAKSGDYPWPYGDGEIIFRGDKEAVRVFISGLLEWAALVTVLEAGEKPIQYPF